MRGFATKLPGGRRYWVARGSQSNPDFAAERRQLICSPIPVRPHNHLSTHVSWICFGVLRVDIHRKREFAHTRQTVIKRPAMLAMLFTAVAHSRDSRAMAQDTPAILPAVKTLTTLPVEVSELVAPLGGKRLYYVSRPTAANKSQAVGGNASDVLWLFDVATNRATPIDSGQMARLSITASGNALTFMRPATGPARAMWKIQLDPMSGLAKGPASRLTIPGQGAASLSPDGETIAFWTTSLNVIPVAGGDQRIVLPGPFRRVFAPAWSSDGKSIFVSTQRDSLTPRVLQRIRIDGGQPIVLLTGTVIGPGVSPDEKHILASKLSQDGAQIVPGMDLFDATGRPIASLALDWNAGAPAQWISAQELLTYSSQRASQLKLALPGKTPRDVLSATDDIGGVEWAPDGTRFAALVRGPVPALVVANADGSGSRRFNIAGFPVGPVVWSPDGGSVALQDGKGSGITVIDVTRRLTRTLLARSLGNVGQIRWTTDGQRIRYDAAIPAGSGNPSAPRMMLREISLDGSDRSIARLPMAWVFISDSTVLLTSDTASYVHSLASGRSVEVFRGRTLKPSVSRDGRWIAFRPPETPASNVHRQLEIVSADGARIASLTFPFQSGNALLDRFQFSADGQRISGAGKDTLGECCVVFDIPVRGGPARVLTDVVPHYLAKQNFSVSPTGALLFTTPGAFRTVVQSVDLTRAMRR